MNQFNDKRQYHGYWEYYWYNRNIIRKGDFNMSKQIGYLKRYSENGELTNKQFFL
jgi:antitoxin component YwqK of YwqJK toxin-antitoxin module